MLVAWAGDPAAALSDAPVIGVVMGSESDFRVMSDRASAHRMPDGLVRYEPEPRSGRILGADDPAVGGPIERSAGEREGRVEVKNRRFKDSL